METGQLWDDLRGLVEQARAGRYWTERRDAIEELHKIARQAIFRLQQASRDQDPDVGHWSKEACAGLARMTAAPSNDLAPKIDKELADGGKDPDTPHEAVNPVSAPPASTVPLATAEGLLAWLEAFAREQNGFYAAKPKGANVTLPLDHGRKQTLQLDLSHKDSEGEALALFYSIAGEAGPEHYLWALQANSNLSGEAFGIIQSQGKNLLVMVLRCRLAELNESWLRRRLFYMARKADWAEQNIHEQDEH